MDTWVVCFWVSLSFAVFWPYFPLGSLNREWANYQLGRLIGARRIDDGESYRRKMHLKAFIVGLFPIIGLFYLAGWLLAGGKDYDFGLHVGRGDEITREILETIV